MSPAGPGAPCLGILSHGETPKRNNHSDSLGLCVFALNLLSVYFAFKEKERGLDLLN